MSFGYYLTLPVERKVMSSKALWSVLIGTGITVLIGMGSFLFVTVWNRTEGIPEIRYEVKSLNDKVEIQARDIREVRDTLRGWEAQVGVKSEQR